MPFERVGRNEALSKSEFHQRIRDWLDKTDDEVIGPHDIKYPRTGWVHVRDGSDILVLNSDTPRDAVDRYFHMVTRFGNDLQWNRTESQQGKRTAVEYGPDKLRCKSFYLYYVSPEAEPVYSPFLTWRFDTAFQFASGLHHKQARKGVNIPYLAHLMSVCALVIEAGGDEDQAIAGLLHDAVEDQGGLPTLATIRHMFGDRVANTVEGCSDSTATDATEKPPWTERKAQYLEHLRHANPDILLVSAADKLHNARAILADYRELGDELWSRFNAPKEDQLRYYRALVETLQKAAAPKALVDELRRVVEELDRLVK
jgi:hypothetical protein